MKKIFLILAACIFTLCAMAGDGNNTSIKHPNKYCAKMQDGKLTVVHQGNEITADVTLANGIIIQPDGTIVMKDGTTVVLKEGECVDKEGKIIEENSKIKPAKEKNKVI